MMCVRYTVSILTHIYMSQLLFVTVCVFAWIESFSNKKIPGDLQMGGKWGKDGAEQGERKKDVEETEPDGNKNRVQKKNLSGWK